eukprot:90956-Pyramimonas_sp.AAC.1
MGTNHALRLLSTHALQHFRKTVNIQSYYSVSYSEADVPKLSAAMSGERDISQPALLALRDDEYIPAAFRAQ